MTMHGRVLKRGEKLKSYEVADGCTSQVTNRLRGGGRHKDKKSQKEKKQAASTRTSEQKFAEEVKSVKGPATQEYDRDTVVRMMEENEDNRKRIERMSEGSDADMEQMLQNYRTAGYEVLGWDQERIETMERGLRWADEARRKARRTEREQAAGQQQGEKDKQVHFGEEESSEETQAESTDKPKVMSRLAEVLTGRGGACIVQGRDEKCLTNETHSKGKGKGNGGKGEHGSKGRVGSKGAQQIENLMMDEDQQNMREMTNEEEKEEMELEMMQKEDIKQEEQRGRVAPNMEAGGSHLQATPDPREEEARERRPRWADCEDDEGKEEEEQETEKRKAARSEGQERAGERERDKARKRARGADEKETTRSGAVDEERARGGR